MHIIYQSNKILYPLKTSCESPSCTHFLAQQDIWSKDHHHTAKIAIKPHEAANYHKIETTEEDLRFQISE